MMKKGYINKMIILGFLVIMGCKDQEKEPLENTHKITDFSKLLQPVSRESVLVEEGYYVWGGSVVKGDDGLYHMFYSRWLKTYGFNAWVTHSEVAHAVSETPEGPFKHKDIALPVRDKSYWDGLTTHNPTIHKFSDKYYLYYMGTTGDREIVEGLNFIHRNNQRIGVAWADSPNGPWNRFDKPLIDVSSNDMAYDALMVSNPSVTKMKDGKILMIYKAVSKQNPLPFGGPVTHLAAISDNPLEGFEKIENPIFYKEGKQFPAEDPYIWYHKSSNQYYAIVKDMKGTFTNAGTSLAFFESKDGLDWIPSKNTLVSKTEIHWSDGEITPVGRLERPQLLMEKGKPIMLYCAATLNENTMNVHIPIINNTRVISYDINE